MIRKTGSGLRSSSTQARGLLLFAVGGTQVAARAEEVESVMPWSESMPVPSRTPFVHALVRRDQAVLPVFDLAARLDVTIGGSASLCVIAKHVDGLLAIRIDPEVPVLHMVEPSAIRPDQPADPDLLGTYMYESHAIPVLSLARLGKACANIPELVKNGR